MTLTKMKPASYYIIVSITIIGLLNAKCKKSESEPPPIVYKTLNVLELKTMSPLAGAEVNMYVCKRWAYGSCADGGVIGPITSDHAGQFQFNSTVDVYFIDASHERYWDGSTGGTGIAGNRLPVTDILLTPVASTKIHLRKINSHSALVALEIDLYPDPYDIFSPVLRKVYSQPVDSTVVIPGYGYTNNLIKWHFINQSGNVDSTEGRGTDSRLLYQSFRYGIGRN